MSIIRAARKSQYYTLPTATIEDDRLSWEARGLLVYLLSKPDHWKIQMLDLKNRTKGAIGKSSGRDKIYSIINELRAAGYVYREFNRQGGNFVGVEYEVSEIPDLDAAAQYLSSSAAKTKSPFPDLPETVTPDTATPFTPNPETLVKIERAVKIEKAVKNTSDLDPANEAASDGMPVSYPRNPASKTYPAWHAYAAAYRAKYKSWPLYNKTVGAQMGKIVARVGELAPAIAVYYLKKEDSDYVAGKRHPVAMLLQDCEGYATKVDQAERSRARAEMVTEAVNTAMGASASSQVTVPTESTRKLVSAGLEALSALGGSRSKKLMVAGAQ